MWRCWRSSVGRNIALKDVICGVIWRSLNPRFRHSAVVGRHDIPGPAYMPNSRESKVGAVDSSILAYVEVSNLDAETNTWDE
jgi:hypothetical protein